MVFCRVDSPPFAAIMNPFARKLKKDAFVTG